MSKNTGIILSGIFVLCLVGVLAFCAYPEPVIVTPTLSISATPTDTHTPTVVVSASVSPAIVTVTAVPSSPTLLMVTHTAVPSPTSTRPPTVERTITPSPTDDSILIVKGTTYWDSSKAKYDNYECWQFLKQINGWHERSLPIGQRMKLPAKCDG